MKNQINIKHGDIVTSSSNLNEKITGTFIREIENSLSEDRLCLIECKGVIKSVSLKSLMVHEKFNKPFDSKLKIKLIATPIRL